MLQSRRGFLIGAGVVLTTAFVKDARSFIDRTSQPLLATPSQVVMADYPTLLLGKAVAMLREGGM